MSRFVALGVAAVGVTIASRFLLPRKSRHRLRAAAGHWVTERMAHMMASLPEDAPPKLIMTILPKLRAQNEQIITLLQEQNGLLRKRQRAAR